MRRDLIDLMFRAFSDRTRLRILHLLLGGESCVGDIVEVLRLPQPKVSRHLGYLRKAGLVAVRKAGLWCFYSLAPVESPFHKNLLDCIACCFGDVPELKADARRAAKVKAHGGCCPKPQGDQSCPRRSSNSSGSSTATAGR
ncbi:MAG TPA: metalloregulator ArsR/SmtB family transcription factor [Gemmataceae bacterium]|nr:metalloregulator ArsR/SmtB family transcription factor [Gemmataceae bacterium]